MSTGTRLTKPARKIMRSVKEGTCDIALAVGVRAAWLASRHQREKVELLFVRPIGTCFSVQLNPKAAFGSQMGLCRGSETIGLIPMFLHLLFERGRIIPRHPPCSLRLVVGSNVIQTSLDALQCPLRDLSR
ncbi:MAG: hypothetical protein JWR80_2201 [Bradyrhizobium sp.]|nr:hypothetical protein [Bradyrhizobium sp.]